MSTVERLPADVETSGLRRKDFLRRTAVAGAAATGVGAFVAREAQAHGSNGASSPLDRRGLHNRINRIDRVVTNVSDCAAVQGFLGGDHPPSRHRQDRSRHNSPSATSGSRAAASTATCSRT